MKTFDYSALIDRCWDNETIAYLTALHEARGRQRTYTDIKPEALNRLVEIAKIQSTEASNAIEGIRTTDTRLKQLMGEKTAPRNRDEREIMGYRDALNVVHESFEYIPVTPEYILQLHKIMFKYTASDFGGKFKNVQNYICATDGEGKRFTLFTPLAPYETPNAMRALCDAYNIALGEGSVDPLLLIPIFIHDFLCIHPFIDGNGRMSRLLTTLLLYRSGYYVGKYISLEAQIARNKVSYYAALERSQYGWHEGKDDPAPFIKYILGTIIGAYREFEERMNIIESKQSSMNTIRSAIMQRIGKFTKADICAMCPSFSVTSVERGLKELCRRGEIIKGGSGRATYYVRR